MEETPDLPGSFKYEELVSEHVHLAENVHAFVQDMQRFGYQFDEDSFWQPVGDMWDFIRQGLKVKEDEAEHPYAADVPTALRLGMRVEMHKLNGQINAQRAKMYERLNIKKKKVTH